MPSLLLLLAALVHFDGLFVGGTYLGWYDARDSFARAEAHSVNIGASFSLLPGMGFDVLPLVIGPDGHGGVATGAAIFWRAYLWRP